AEDGIRDKLVTGVQTCALPIWWSPSITVGGRTRGRIDYVCFTRQGFAGTRHVDCRRCGWPLMRNRTGWTHRCEGVGYNTDTGARSEERRVGKECRYRG